MALEWVNRGKWAGEPDGDPTFQLAHVENGYFVAYLVHDGSHHVWRYIDDEHIASGAGATIEDAKRAAEAYYVATQWRAKS